MLLRFRQLFQPAHIRDFDPLKDGMQAPAWLALEPRILLDGAIGETTADAVNERSAVIDLNGATEAGTDYETDYPTSAVSTFLLDEEMFVADEQDDIVLLEIQVGGDLLENMDAVRIGDRFVNFSRTESYDDAIAGDAQFDMEYDAETGIISIFSANDPGEAISAADLTTILRSVEYGNLDLDPRVGTLTFGFRALDAEGNVSAESVARMNIDSDGANPYADLDPDRSNSVGDVFQATFREEDGLGVSIADGDVTIVSRGNEPIRMVLISLTQPQEGDELRIQVPSDIEGITANVQRNDQGGIEVRILTDGQSAGTNYEDLARVIQSVRFVNESEDPSDLQRVINVQLLEGNTYGVPTRLRLQVVPENDAPTLDLELGDVTEFGPDYATTWREDGPGVAIINVGASELIDVDDDVLQGATVVNRDMAAGDRFTFDGPLPNGITAVVSEDGSRIDFEGTATLPQYVRALESVRFSADPQDPTEGVRRIVVTVNDGQDRSNNATALVTVEAENDAPMVVQGPLDDRQDGLDGTPLEPVEASESFRDVDDDELIYTFVGPTPDWLAIDAQTGRITGTPPADASQIRNPTSDIPGRYEVRVRATDPDQAFAETTVFYQIDNPDPIAVDDFAEANDGGPRITGNVLTGPGADSDPDGDAISVGLVEASTANVGETVPGSRGGTFVIEADGDYTFDPGTDFLYLTPGESRTTAVTYRVSDGEGGFDQATLVVTVQGTNNGPDARDDGFATAADRPISGNLLIDNGTGVDSDPDEDRLTVAELNGATYTPGERTALPSGGFLTLRTDGSYTYDPGRTFETLALGETVEETFTYGVRDPFGATSQATVTIVVRGTNEAPIPLDPSRPATDPVGPDNPDGPATDPDDPREPPLDPQDYIPLQAHVDGETIEPFALAPWFGDPDAGDELTYSVVPDSLPAGLAYDPDLGAIVGTLDPSASQGGRSGVHVVPVTATDPHGASFTTNLTITVANPGPIAADDAFAVDHADILLGDVMANNGGGEDIDPDGDALAVTSPTAPLRGSVGGTFTIARDGGLTFDPGSDFDDLARGETRETAVIYTISDGEGGTSEATVTVTVGSANSGPRLIDPADTQSGSDAETLLPFDVSAIVDDPDGDDLTFELDADAPDWLSIDPGTGLVTGTPPSDASVGGPDRDGRYPVRVLVSDGIETLEVPLVWEIANPAPVAEPDAFTTSADASVTGNVLEGRGADTDPDGDALTIVGPFDPVTGTTGGTFTFRLDGTVEFDPADDFADLRRGESRETVATYTVGDGQGGTDTATVTITVTGPNIAPGVTGSAAERRGVDARPLDGFDAASLFDDPDGDPLVFSLGAGAPEWMTIDPRTGRVTGTPPNDASAGGENGDGVYRIAVIASDGLETAEVDVAWRIVNPGPDANDDTYRVRADTDAMLRPTVNDDDPDGDAVMVMEVDGVPIAIGDVLKLDSGATLTVVGPQSFVWSPSDDLAAMAAGESMVESFDYTLVDAQGARSVATARVFAFGVVPDPVGPVAPPVVPPTVPGPGDPFVPVLTGATGDPILTPIVGEIRPLSPPVDIDVTSPVPILTQAVEQVAHLGGDVALFGHPILMEALDRIAATDAADARWTALLGDVFKGHELTLSGVTFRSSVSGDVTYLDLGSFGGAGYEGWRATGDGAARLAMLDRNILQIERPADRDHVHLDIDATGPDGRAWRVPLRVDMVHGEIRAEGRLAPVERIAVRETIPEQAFAARAPVPLPVAGGDVVLDLSRPFGSGQCAVPSAAAAAFEGGAAKR